MEFGIDKIIQIVVSNNIRELVSIKLEIEGELLLLIINVFGFCISF